MTRILAALAIVVGTLNLINDPNGQVVTWLKSPDGLSVIGGVLSCLIGLTVFFAILGVVHTYEMFRQVQRTERTNQESRPIAWD